MFATIASKRMLKLSEYRLKKFLVKYQKACNHFTFPAMRLRSLRLYGDFYFSDHSDQVKQFIAIIFNETFMRAISRKGVSNCFAISL